MQSEKEYNRINKVIESAMKNLGSLVDVNTVVGSPIKTEDGDTVIPVSKVTFGILSGGGEYGKLNIFKKSSDLPYSAGNGAVVSIKPCGFLLKTENGGYRVLSIADNAYENLIEKAAGLIVNSQTKEDVNI